MDAFDQGPQTLHFWKRLVRQAVRLAPTPCFVFSAEPINAALVELKALQRSVPIGIRHWLSCKTQPLPPLLRWWRRQGLDIEVVSEFELKAALREGFAPSQILVNGPAKHRWLGQYPLPGLRVNFDSSNELRSLCSLARRLNWSVGLRCHTEGEVDPEAPQFPTQFGMDPGELASSIERLRRAKVRLETLHFHLRTNVAAVDSYAKAAVEVAQLCRATRFFPKHLDLGGGFPAPHVESFQGRRYDADFSLRAMAAFYRKVVAQFPGLEELWLENGRFVSARSGVLIVRILEAKDRGRVRHLICDGGRTLNALVSSWESHDMFSLPTRAGGRRLTSVCGPTCMAYDSLTRRLLPRTLRPGDWLVWMDAGAYHLSWETRFSHGAAAVLWHEAGALRLVRSAETFDSWWGQWSAPGESAQP